MIRILNTAEVPEEEIFDRGGQTVSQETEAAVRAIRRIAEDGELRKKLRKNGLKTVQGRDWKELAEEIIECYLQLINNPFH